MEECESPLGAIGEGRSKQRPLLGGIGRRAKICRSEDRRYRGIREHSGARVLREGRVRPLASRVLAGVSGLGFGVEVGAVV